MTKNKSALFTTVYPEGAKYLNDWYSSVNHQDTSEFDIWIGCDRLSIEEAQNAMGGRIEATWIIRNDNELPIQFRERAIRKMIDQYSGIIFVDSDDILEPSRVSSAQNALEHCDAYGCSMCIIDESGNDLSIEFNRPPNVEISDLLLRNNIFGLTNTAYNSETLKKCLPFPQNCVLLDWFIATMAMNNNAKMFFDDIPKMKYRQHSANTAPVLPPFSNQQILYATELVLQHYDIVLKNIPKLNHLFKSKITFAKNDVLTFYNSMIQSKEKLDEYTKRLNKLPAKHIWWSCVAHPDLEELWKQ
ncbi:hypothetical protein [Methanogenium sp. MK-MG]|uniref:hypothetical protein n=1 Tax=Methanogenium sp. MK-MG TaxID=2599926 RepID=UPI0013EACE94|nr:hypothetical protein [Methanogenium sp. MK-MG]KAF1076908.1 hypothetical protein MKMG_01413 [Methanogenium sp. MK-MG]